MAQNSGASSQPTPVELIVSISEMLLKMHEVETSINTFDVGNEVAVQQALAAYQQQLHQLRARIKSSSSQPDGALSRLEVPSALLRALDAGVSPDNFLKDMFLASKRDNQLAKGKIGALETFREQMMQQTQTHFPDAAAAYKQMEAGPGPGS